ncbi:MAG: ABC transporter substrate-binding protein [Gammaproteobacteria bacterium]
MSSTLSRRTFLKSIAATAGVSYLGLPRNGLAARARCVARIERDIQTLDPAFRIGAEEGNIIRAVCQRLVSFKPDSLEYEPDAAADIKQTSATLIEFTLKPGQMFQGGFGEMTADDVKFSFERFITATQDGKESAYKGDWEALDQVEVTGKYTGRIHLKQPAPALWRIALADVSGCILSRAATEKLGTKIATQVIGSGAYIMASWEPNQQVLLKANPDYQGPKPHFPEIVIKPIAELKTAEIAFRASELDFTKLDPSGVDALRGAADTQIVELPGMNYTWIGLNVEKAPFDNAKVREAVRLAIDIDAAVLAGYNGKVKRANTMIQPQLLGHWADAPARARDVAAAQKLLAEAGLAAGFKCRLTVLNQAEFKAMGLVAQANLAEAGIQAELEVLDAGSYWSVGEGDNGKNLDMALQQFAAKMDPSFTSQWFVSDQVGVWNWQRWRNPEYDRLHKLAASTLDERARADAVIQMQKLMDESGAFIWLTYGANLFATRQWLKPAVLPNGTDWQYRYFREV